MTGTKKKNNNIFKLRLEWYYQGWEQRRRLDGEAKQELAAEECTNA